MDPGLALVWFSELLLGLVSYYSGSRPDVRPGSDTVMSSVLIQHVSCIE